MGRANHLQEVAKQEAPDLDGPVREDELVPELRLPILILAPLRNDARFTATFLASAGLTGIVCEDVQAICAYGSARSGALLLAEEALNNDSVPLLSEYLSSQPRWSDLPVIIITSNGDDTLDRRCHWPEPIDGLPDPARPFPEVRDRDRPETG